MKRILLNLILVLFILPCWGKAQEFSSSVGTQAKPWTNTNFCAVGENDFHFVIMGDRTGAARKGIYARGLQQANMLRPDFIISVGDLVEGVKKYNPVRIPADHKLMTQQLRAFDTIVTNNCTVPFFRIPGNHDLTSKVAFKVWAERYGSAYYWFRYRDVLFLCLNSCDDPDNPESPSLREKQTLWAIKTLKDHSDVRWTLVFMHHPLWLYDGKQSIEFPGGTKPIKAQTGFPEIESALGNRNYTVFAGHTHAYRKYIRRNREYYILGVSGGYLAQQPLNRKTGILDHFMWVSFSKEEPTMANIAIDGVMDSHWGEPALQVGQKQD